MTDSFHHNIQNQERSANLELNKIYLGDNIEVMKLHIPDNSIDLVVTSPPYDNIRSYSGSIEWGKDIWEEVIRQLFRIIKDGGVVVWVVNDATIDGSETLTSFKQALYFREVGFNVHDTMIWRKLNYIPQNSNRYESTFEYMFVFSKGSPKTFNPIKEPKRFVESGGANFHRNKEDETLRCAGNSSDVIDKMLCNVWEFWGGSGHTTKDKIAFKHPAIFPDALAYNHIVSWSNEGDIVLDPFAGSGTVGKIAKMLKRKYILIEKVPEYIGIIEARLRTVQRLLF